MIPAAPPPSGPPLDLSALSGLAPEVASTVASVGGDIALVIGADGVIRSVADGAGSLASAASGWVGLPWIETVTVETRRKVELLLQEVRGGGVARRREVNHTAAGGVQVPVAYSAVQLGAHGPVLAVGRDLSTVAAIQQRFVEAQHDLERDYWQRRQADARFRLLFQVLNDAVLLVDAVSFEVLEANAAAERLFASAPGELRHTRFPERIEPAARGAVAELLASTRTHGRAAELRVRPNGQRGPVEISATPFRSDNRQLLLVRARRADHGGHGGPTAGVADPARPADASAGLDDQRRLIEFVQQSPDGVVITDTTGRVLMANPAFARLCGSRPEDELRGHSLDELLGDSQGRWVELLTRARQRGIAIQDVVAIATRDGVVPVDAVAAMLPEGDQECIGFSLRPQRAAPMPTPVMLPGLPGPAPEVAADADLVNELQQLTQRVGRLPLADMLSEVQFIAERHLIGLALRAAQGRHEDAARGLGLTVEGLELRMRRHQLPSTHGQADKPLLN